MKYLRQENNRFIFEYGGDELELKQHEDFGWFEFSNVLIDTDLDIAHKDFQYMHYKDIQTAVQMMTILKDKRLV
jgi:hypothetical protein